MHLLIVSATSFEISKTAVWLNTGSQGLNVLKPKLLISGIGQLQTGYALLKQIAVLRPRMIIQAGIGGSADPTDLGRVFAIAADSLADLGAQEQTGFSSIFQMGLDNPDRFPFTAGKLVNPYEHLLSWTGLPVLEGTTVNEIKSANFADFQRNDARVVESMEGAALHYVGLMEIIPFLQIRSVSNVLGDRDKSRWKLKEAINKLNETLVSLIQKLEKADETLFRI
jgi:futalosine hydrolase